MSAELLLRPELEADQAFSFQVFCSTRPDVMAANLEETEMQQFLQMQYRAQYVHYRNTFANAEYYIVMLGERKVGRIYVDRRADEIRILDIALLPEFRNQGIGTRLVRNVIEEARHIKKPTRIHVELGSREIQFYERLGFTKIGEIPTHQLMEVGTEHTVVA